MAAVADACIGELAKLREKVRAKSPFLLRSWKRDAVKEAGESKASKDDSSSSTAFNSPAKKPRRSEEIMPETTVLLLMDRCAPC